MDNVRGDQASLRTYFVYIVASRSRNIYTGVTNDLERRISQHKQGFVQGFTRRYRIHRLVYITRSSATSVLRLRERRKSNTGTEKNALR
jgi:putative endonuclease